MPKKIASDTFLLVFKIVKSLQCRLKCRKQCVSINNIKSTFQEIIRGVPQGSIADPILFNIFFSDFFCFILVALAPNFADEDTFPSFAQTIENLISILESESEIAIN